MNHLPNRLFSSYMSQRRNQPINSYEEAIAYLLSKTDYERQLGSSTLSYETRDFNIVRFRDSLRFLGDPHLKYASVHVAGTKGKGSTCAMIAAALGGGGLTVGLYTSPHLVDFTERIRINGRDIGRNAFADLVNRLRAAGIGHDDNPAGFRTVFEMLTAAGFVAFAEAGAEVAVVETGLGGRLDSTNVFQEPSGHPHVAVITAIGFDHQSLLGDTIVQIAGEKAGIIHRSGPVVLSGQPVQWADEVERVVRRRAAEVGAPVLKAADLLRIDRVANEVRLSLTGAGREEFPTQTPLAEVLAAGVSIELSLSGAHQLENCRAAVVALLALEKTGKIRPFNASGLLEGLSGTCWPGRIEMVARNPVVIVDGAHCPLSVEALALDIGERFPGSPVHIVCGFLKDKNVGEMLSVAAAKLCAASVRVTAPDNPRALPVGEAAGLVRQAFAVPVSEEPDPETAVAAAMEEARRDGGIVLFFGSLYLVAAVKAEALKSA